MCVKRESVCTCERVLAIAIVLVQIATKATKITRTHLVADVVHRVETKPKAASR